MQPSTTIRTAEPRELLALIPFQLGFQPQDSAVVVSLRGSRSRVGLVARVDLADLVDEEDGPQVARSLVTHLVSDGARRCVLVLYTESPSQTPAEVRRASDHFQSAAEYFLGEAPCWVVGPDGYYGLGCEDVRCCPPGGRPLTGLQSTEVGAQMVLNGARVAGSRSELVQIPAATAAGRRSTRRAAQRWAARLPADATLTSAHGWRREGLGLWRRELTRAADACVESRGGAVAVGVGADRGPHRWQVPDATVLGRLQAALADVLVRDAALLSFVEGTERVADRVIAGDGGHEVGTALQAIVDPTVGTPPEPERLAGARMLLEQVVAHSARRSQAPALTLLALLAWWEGDGARAGLLVDQALDAEPGYRLGRLVDETLAAGMPPGWLRDRGACES